MQGHVPLEFVQSAAVIIIPGKGAVTADEFRIFFPEQIEPIPHQPCGVPGEVGTHTEPADTAVQSPGSSAP